MEFKALQIAVANQMAKLQKHDLYRVDTERDEMYETYISSFPEGTNPIYRKQTEHECSCCRHFIRDMGNIVAFIDGKMVSLWDIKIPDEPGYQTVVDAMAAVVKGKIVKDEFLHYERNVGAKQTLESLLEGGFQKWNHFHSSIDPKFYADSKDIPTLLGKSRTSKETFKRALDEITDEAVAVVVELISDKRVYRAEDYKGVVDAFRKTRIEYKKLKTDVERDMFAWTRSDGGSMAAIRNSAIGSLMVDLSEDVDLEEAVKQFERKVAPQNYNRTSALITKGMVKKSQEEITKLGLLPALDRRHATLGDISINNLIFADRGIRLKLRDSSVFDALAEETVSTKKFNSDKLEEVTIEHFLSEIVPKANSIEVLFDHKHKNNMMSLIAPADPTAGHLFKWDNNFSWSYAGEFADSIKERVKKAGGNVTGELCCRLSWSNYDDLDFHMQEPGGYEIYFANRGYHSPSGGKLDVDMNAGRGTTREPVENIFYSHCSSMKEGEYKLQVHQFNQRESKDVGFTVEVDYKGQVTQYHYPQAVRDTQTIDVLTFNWSKKNGMEIVSSLGGNAISEDIWGLQTNQLHKVKAIMLSPNYWDDKEIGNKHYFFLLDGCNNPEQTRGFYNEFLRNELNPHRKVFEVLGSKMRVEPTQDQLSGIGISYTQKTDMVVKVSGAYTRMMKVVF